MHSRKHFLTTLGLLTMGTMFFTALGWTAAPDDALGRAALSRKKLEKRWGIEISSLRLSGNGNLVDFRYKVIDPDKAAELGDPEAKPFLVDQASGAKLLVPKTPKIGPLRQTAQKPEPGRVYFVLFSNPGRIVKSGSQVTLNIGDFHASNLVVD